MDFGILFTSKKIFHGRDSAAPLRPIRGGPGRADQRWLRRDFPGSGKRDLPVTPDVGNRGTKSGISVLCQSEVEVVLRNFTRNLQQQEQQTAANSCGLC